MPGSMDEGKDQIKIWIQQINPKTVLDVGCGKGTYSDIFKDLNMKPEKFDALEVWKPYINKYKLAEKYNNIINVDAREHKDWDYDLVILVDVLEHMTKEEAIAIWQSISKQARYAIISIPIVHYPQGHEHGNPYEEHVKDDWTTEEVLKTFSNITIHKAHNVVGVFVAKF